MKNMKKQVVSLFFILLVMTFGQNSIAQSINRFKSGSLYTDIKAHRIGDIVTILISESTSGSQQSDLSGSSKADLKANGGVTGNLTSVLPLLGASSSFENSQTDQAGTAQKDGLTGRLTAVVTEILPNGNLQLQGKRKLAVNGETYLLDIKGTVRPKDIASDNIVLSYNLANVEIAYKKDGFLNKLGKPGVIARWTTWAMVMGLGAAAVLGISAAN